MHQELVSVSESGAFNFVIQKSQFNVFHFRGQEDQGLHDCNLLSFVLLDSTLPHELELFVLNTPILVKKVEQEMALFDNFWVT